MLGLSSLICGILIFLHHVLFLMLYGGALQYADLHIYPSRDPPPCGGATP